MWALALAAVTILTVFSTTTFAETTNQLAQGVVKKFENVEDLLDNVAEYDGRRVQVSGEVEKIIDTRSFILEGGGIFNDEIIVFIPEKGMIVTEDSDVTVTGVVRTVGFVEIEREYGWDLDPQVKTELEKVKVYLIAENIAQDEDDND
jgi:hypothetical protein